MEKEIEGLKIEGREREKEGEGGEGRGKEGIGREGEKTEGWKERVKRLERKIERKEREERRKNIVVKGLKEEDENAKGLEKVWKKLGVEVKVEEVKRVRAGGGRGGGIVIVKVGSEEEKKGIMQSKRKLRGEEVWIEEDLTWEERRVRWKIRQIAIMEETREKRVRIGQGGLWVEGKWWGWDEEKGEITDMDGRSWEKERGEQKGKKEEEMHGHAEIQRRLWHRRSTEFAIAFDFSLVRICL